MATLLTADLPSDEEDDDYNPDLDPTRGRDDDKPAGPRKKAAAVSKRG